MVKDRIKKIRKTSKSEVEILDGMSAKKLHQSGNSASSFEDIKCEPIKKKQKKDKLHLETSEINLKSDNTLVNSESAPSSDKSLATQSTDGESGKIKKDISYGKVDKNKNVVGPHSSDGNKDSLMGRLRSESSYIGGVLSLLHVPKHRQHTGDDSDEDDGGKIMFK